MFTEQTDWMVLVPSEALRLVRPTAVAWVAVQLPGVIQQSRASETAAASAEFCSSRFSTRMRPTSSEMLAMPRNTPVASMMPTIVMTPPRSARLRLDLVIRHTSRLRSVG